MTVKTNEDLKTKHMTPQTKKILEKLKRKSKVYNYELNKICFRYAARVHDLRKLGHKIESKCEGLGIWSFKLIK